MAGKQQKSQLKVINEIKNQLLIQAEILGMRHEYDGMAMEEMRLDAAHKILSSFYMEKANLEYERDFLGSSSKENAGKLYKLEGYLAKAHRFIDRARGQLEKILERSKNQQEQEVEKWQ